MMLSLKDFDNPQDKASDTSLLNPNIDSELEHWEKLVFSFDMDGGDSNNNGSSSSAHNNNPDRRNTRSRSHSVNQQGQGSNAPMVSKAFSYFFERFGAVMITDLSCLEPTSMMPFCLPSFQQAGYLSPRHHTTRLTTLCC